MGIFRHSTLFVSRLAFADTDLDSGSLSIRPADGDQVRDDVQAFTLLLFVEQRGAGAVLVEVLTSMGDGVWFVPASRKTSQNKDKMGWAVELGRFGPFLKVRIRAEVPAGGRAKPTFRAVARLVSNGPYKVAPAPQQDIVEVVIQEPAGGGGDA